jgi:hypothetical protein
MIYKGFVLVSYIMCWENYVYNGNECKSDGVISTCLLVTVALILICIKVGNGHNFAKSTKGGNTIKKSLIHKHSVLFLRYE